MQPPLWIRSTDNSKTGYQTLLVTLAQRAPQSPNLEDSLPHQSTKVQALEEATHTAQGAAWGAAQGAGRG